MQEQKEMTSAQPKVESVQVMTNRGTGYVHTHRAGDFHFTPLRVGDLLMENHNLRAEQITKAATVASLNDVQFPALQEARRAGVDFDTLNGVLGADARKQVIPVAGLLFPTKKDAALRSPMHARTLVLREGYRAVEIEPKGGNRTWRIIDAAEEEKK